MSYCPFCNQPILDENWSYCHSCNKPLITNIEEELFNTIKPPLESTYSPDLLDKDVHFEFNIIADESVERELAEVENELAECERLGRNMGTLLLKKASLFYKKRDLQGALKNLELALENFKLENNLLNSAISHNEIGLINEEIGYYEQAIYHLDRSLSIIRELGDTHKEIQILNNIGNVYYLLNDLQQSYKFYQKALTLAETANFEEDSIKSSSNLVETLFSLKEYDRIKKILTNNLEYFSRKKDMYGLIQTYIKFGKLYYFWGNDYYDQSFEYFNKSLELIYQIESQIPPLLKPKLEWESNLYLGKIHISWDNDFEAENLLLKSLEAIRTYAYQDHINEGLVLSTLAKLYSVKGEDEKAIEYYNYAIEIYEKFGDKFKVGEIKTNIAKIYYEYIQDFSKAKKYYEEALEIFESQNLYKLSAEILKNLGNLYLYEQEYEIAISKFESAMEYYKEINDCSTANLMSEKIVSIRDSESYE